MNNTSSLLLSLLLATAAHGGWLTGAANGAGKVLGHDANNAAEYVIAHYGDDVAVACILLLVFIAVTILSFTASRRIENALPHRQASPVEASHGADNAV